MAYSMGTAFRAPTLEILSFPSFHLAKLDGSTAVGQSCAVKPFRYESFSILFVATTQLRKNQRRVNGNFHPEKLQLKNIKIFLLQMSREPLNVIEH